VAAGDERLRPLWALVVFNSLLFIIFAASFFHPQSKRDWRALGGFSAFVVALFTEMYGYPLSVYLLSGPLSGLIPGVNLSHNSGHLWNGLIGWKGDAHVSPFHLASYVFIGGGFWLIAAAWSISTRRRRRTGSRRPDRMRTSVTPSTRVSC
jgi:hypothetical protein